MLDEYGTLDRPSLNVCGIVSKSGLLWWDFAKCFIWLGSSKPNSLKISTIPAIRSSSDRCLPVAFSENVIIFCFLTWSLSVTI
ncbi:MAG: hypothetical protein ACM3VV_02120 [Deltaproteobacteria bacterium]